MIDPEVQTLLVLSRKYGADPRFVIAGGGNTSVKLGDRMLVKASGAALADATVDAFVEMDRTKLQSLLDSTLPADRTQREAAFKTAILDARIHPEKAQRPSVEALLHHLIPGRFVVHTHCTLANMFTCCVDGEKLIREICGDDAIWIPEVDPGFLLARALVKALSDRPAPKAILMQNHGLVVMGDSAAAIDANTDWLLSRLTRRLDGASHADAPFGPIQPMDPAAARAWIETIAPALRGLLSEGPNLKVVTFDDSPEVMALAAGAVGHAIATAGPLTPDQIVYCKSFILWTEFSGSPSPAECVEQLRRDIAAHRDATGSNPLMVLVRGLGLFAAGEDVGGARTARDIYGDIARVTAGAHRLGGVRRMDDSMRRFIEDWEVESYRKQVAAAARRGRVVGKIAVVTGAAQGFGLEMSTDLAKQGAAVALGDINLAGTESAVKTLNAALGKPRAIALAMDVTRESSVADALHRVVREFGGFDVLISNAGVLKAESVKTQPKKDFDFVTAVNYTGYFVCVKAAAPILAIQRMAKPDHWSDIIQINSKSGLQGSNRNGAYAGGKFGGIGLTQSFALELVTDGIKVNAVCPGNFFDGPLWSDPTNGLFAQYLRSGKVPGAQSVADVRRFYESKAPMNRGCTTPDVMKAIYYLIEQTYETGQAIPVTGGQVMLS